MAEYGVEAFYLRHGYRRSNKFQIYWKVIPIYLLKILKAKVYYLITPLSCKYIMLFLIIRLWKKIVLLFEWRFHTAYASHSNAVHIASLDHEVILGKKWCFFYFWILYISEYSMACLLHILNIFIASMNDNLHTFF